MKNFSISELNQIKVYLNTCRSITKTSKYYQVSRTTIYNHFVFDDKEHHWVIKNEFIREFNKLHSNLLSLVARINYGDIKCDGIARKELIQIEKSMRALRGVSIK